MCYSAGCTRVCFFFFQAEDGIRDADVTGVQTCALPILFKVTAVQVKTGLKREDVTSNTGDFNFPLLDVGQYDVSVEKPGFKTETRKGVTLELNQKVRLDFSLQVGALAETIEISTEAAIPST